MAIRSRLKQKIKALLGTSSTQTAKTTMSTAYVPQKDIIEKTIVEPKAARPKSEVSNVVEDVVEKVVENSEPEDIASKVPAKEQTKSTKVSDEKIRKHLLRTKKGLLKFIQKEGGTTDLGALNHHSEIRFLIGHQKFSQLMEEFVAEDLITYNWDTQAIVITEKGIQFFSA